MKIQNIKKITAMAAALVMCLSMVSCGDSVSCRDSDTNAEKSAGTEAAESAAGSADGAATKEDAGSVSPEAGTAEEAREGGSDEDGAAEGGDLAAAPEAETYDITDSDKLSLKGEIAADDGFAGDAALLPEGEAEIAAEPAPGETADDALTGETTGEEPIPADLSDSPDVPVSNDAQAFILTAGEWNDNDNWGFFTNLVKSGTIEFPVFGLDPTNRIAVTVTKDGAPARNQTVELVDSEGKVIWTARSDKNGMAYVFYGKGQTPAEVRSGEASAAVVGGSTDDEQGRAGTTEAKLEVADSKDLEETQVMFILDTTGSMYDEIAYLQMDFSSIAKEVDDGHTTFSANFYRDEGDDYVTKCNPFTNDVRSVQSAINQENADGGGDFPEAVADILEQTITNNDEWSESANKIAFLIFDAPPHDDTEQQLEAAIKTAAAKGIHLVPVVSSGADRETELFGRAAAAQTGSNYVFLTDDSGVGGSHLEPIIGDYEVELLHDVIVRNITELRS